MTYAHAVSIVENILRNATVLQEDREKIDLALAVLKDTGALREELKDIWREYAQQANIRNFLIDPTALSPDELSLANNQDGSIIRVSAEDISKGAIDAIQRHKDRIFAPSQQPVDDPNWPPAPKQKGPEGTM